MTAAKITAGDFSAKLQELLAVAALIDPRVALASAGIDALKSLFSKSGELNNMIGQVYAETVETAPEVAQAVSEFYTQRGDDMEKSFRDHPGK